MPLASCGLFHLDRSQSVVSMSGANRAKKLYEREERRNGKRKRSSRKGETKPWRGWQMKGTHACHFLPSTPSQTVTGLATRTRGDHDGASRREPRCKDPVQRE